MSLFSLLPLVAANCCILGLPGITYFHLRYQDIGDSSLTLGIWAEIFKIITWDSNYIASHFQSKIREYFCRNKELFSPLHSYTWYLVCSLLMSPRLPFILISLSCPRPIQPLAFPLYLLRLFPPRQRPPVSLSTYLASNS